MTAPGLEADISPYARLLAQGISLPRAQPPVANFTNFVIEGNLLFLAGQGPVEADGYRHIGKVGRDVGVEQAYAHARLTGINLVAVMQEALGDLKRVKRVVKLLGMVNATPDFGDHPKIINGCSDLMVEIFGEKGIHARSAVGFGSLPFGITVEIEAVIAIKD